MVSSVNISSKLPKIGVNIFTKMSGLAVQHNAINLSQGFPSFDCHDRLKLLVQKHMEKGNNQYAPMPGVLPLREAIAATTEYMYGLQVDPATEITVTAGATQAIFTAITAFVKEEDEVIIFSPSYDCYQPAVELAKGRSIFLPLVGDDYHIDWQAVQKAVNRKTRMIIINSPHNPTGSVLSAEDLKQLIKITAGSDIIILSDEVYEHIIFDGLRHESVCRYPELMARSMVISSFGKTYHTTGWKMSYCMAPEQLMTEFRKVHQFNVFSVNTPVQHAYAEFLQEREHFLELSAFYQEKRDYFLNGLKGSAFEPIAAKGTYFQLLNYSSIDERQDEEFAVYLAEEKKLAAIPVSVFFADKRDDRVLRFCFAKGNDTLDGALEILQKLK